MNTPPVSPTDVSLPGWQPVPSALGWPFAMYAMAVCDHSGVVLLGGCCISVKLLSVASHCSCHLATRASVVFHRRGWDAVMKLLAYGGGYSRAGGYGGCVAGL